MRGLGIINTIQGGSLRWLTCFSSLLTLQGGIRDTNFKLQVRRNVSDCPGKFSNTSVVAKCRCVTKSWGIIFSLLDSLIMETKLIISMLGCHLQFDNPYELSKQGIGTGHIVLETPCTFFNFFFIAAINCISLLMFRWLFILLLYIALDLLQRYIGIGR